MTGAVKEVNQDLDNIDHCLSNFICDQNIDILPQVLQEVGIEQYFKLLCQELQIDLTTNLSTALNHNTNVDKAIFLNDCIYTALLYEGGHHNKVRRTDMKVMLVYGLFRNNKLLFDEIHNKIDAHKQLNEDQLSLYHSNKNKTVFKTTADWHCVINDTNDMFYYYKQWNCSEIIQRIKDQRYKMCGYQDSLIITSVFTKLHATAWKTRWAKMKSFKRNFPAIVNTNRLLWLKEVS